MSYCAFPCMVNGYIQFGVIPQSTAVEKRKPQTSNVHSYENGFAECYILPIANNFKRHFPFKMG